MQIVSIMLSMVLTCFALDNLFQQNIIYSFALIEKPVTKTIISSCVGWQHGCTVFDTKRMKCWGYKPSLGIYIREGYGDTVDELGDKLPYVDVGTVALIDKVACGAAHSCVLLTTGDVKCLGYNNVGQIGLGNQQYVVGKTSGHIGDNLPMVNFGTGLKAVDVVLGSGFSCIVTVGKKVKCFGDGTVGQLGNEDPYIIGYGYKDMGDYLEFINLGTGVEIDSLHTGPTSFHSCAILSAPLTAVQKLKCWGYNSFYQLGYGTKFSDNRGDDYFEMGDYLPIVDLGTESRVAKLALGEEFTCALLIDDKLKCWGRNSDGQLGTGSNSTMLFTGNELPPVEINAGRKIKHIGSGKMHFCFVYDDDLTMKCIGDNSWGQLGQGDKRDRGNTPGTMIPQIQAIKLGTSDLAIDAIDIGSWFNCVKFVDSSMKCFGINTFGQLGIGSSNTIGDGSADMGKRLKYLRLFSSTKNPTKNPTTRPSNPTILPTNSPLIAPSSVPTSMPTMSCLYPTAKLCNKDSKCIWDVVAGKGTCKLFDCRPLKKTSCKNQVIRCSWSSDTQTCGFKQPKS